MPRNVIMPDELEIMVRKAIERNRNVERTSRSQAAIDRCVEKCYEDGEVQMAAAILFLMAARVSGDLHGMLTVVAQYGADRHLARKAGGN